LGHAGRARLSPGAGGPAEQRTRINGVELAFEAGGAGAPLLFIHGGYGGPSSTLWPGPRFRWDVDAGGIHTIAYDRRCAGDSEYIDAPFTLDDLAADAAALLDHLGHARAIVVASSAGGPIALRLALRGPDRVAALVLVNTGAALTHPRPSGVAAPHSPFVRDRLATVRRRAEIVALARDVGMDAAIAACWDEWRALPPRDMADPYADEHAQLEAALAAVPDAELAHLAAGAVRNLAALIDVDLTPRLAHIVAPTLVLHGDSDTVVPFEYGQVLGQLIPGARFEAVVGAGHGLLMLAEVQRRVVDWLSSAAL